jgi:alkylation response protein AidB-like acyl-CoA dehydrogenase
MIGAIWDNWLGAKLPDEGARAVFNSGTWPITAGLIWPFGKALAVDTGYSVSGRWKFASGINQASWTGSGCTVIDGETPRVGPTGTPLTMIAVVPKERTTVHDTWQTSGLRGTGSCDYSIEDEPVGEGFVFNGLAPTGQRGGPWWRLPGNFHAGPGHAGFALGIARRCLDEVRALGSRRRFGQPSLQAERESVQMELGRRLSEYEAVRLFVLDSFGETWERAERGEPPRVKPLGAYSTEMAVRCAQFAFRVIGADAVFESNPVQRYLRDVLAAQQHIAASDSAFVRYGSEALEADRG